MRILDEKIETAQRELEATKNRIIQLIKEKEHIEELSLDKKVAIFLHDNFCGYNHTDACGWMYEIRNGIHDWLNYSHAKWLSDAQKVIKFLGENK